MLKRYTQLRPEGLYAQLARAAEKRRVGAGLGGELNGVSAD